MPQRDCTLLVYGLEKHTDATELRKLFEVFGPVVSAGVDEVYHPACQASGFVSFASPDAATAAIASMKGFRLRGTSIQVKLASLNPAEWIHLDDRSSKQAIARAAVCCGRVGGTVLSWHGHYGWVQPDVCINHSGATKHEGRVFVDVRDVGGHAELSTGDRISFNVYADGDGIGAADVRPGCTGDGLPSTFNNTISAGDLRTELKVEGWPPSLEDHFRKTFEQFGRIRSATVGRPKQGECRSSGSLNFEAPEAARRAIEAMNGREFGGKPLTVMFRKQQPEASLLRGESTVPSLVCLPTLAAQIEDPLAGRWTGSVKIWKGRFGWIVADKSINHPMLSKHSGLVYVHRKDIEGGNAELETGAKVSFTLYVDDDGIGASVVRLEQGAQRVSNHKGARDATRPPARWWHDLAGDCCPISLTPLEELEHEPFGLMGSNSSEQQDDFQGIWGVAACAAFQSGAPVHWFDGTVLACSLVSKGHLVDPVSIRPLFKEECAGLDAYLDAIGFPPVNVAEVFHLSAAVAANEATVEERRRLESLGHEAASMLRILDEEGPILFTASGSTTEQLPSATARGTTPAARKRRWGREP